MGWPPGSPTRLRLGAWGSRYAPTGAVWAAASSHAWPASPSMARGPSRDARSGGHVTVGGGRIGEPPSAIVAALRACLGVLLTTHTSRNPGDGSGSCGVSEFEIRHQQVDQRTDGCLLLAVKDPVICVRASLRIRRRVHVDPLACASQRLDCRQGAGTPCRRAPIGWPSSFRAPAKSLGDAE